MGILKITQALEPDRADGKPELSQAGPDSDPPLALSPPHRQTKCKHACPVRGFLLPKTLGLACP